MKNKFLNISLGVTIMLLGAGFFMRSIPSASAAPSPKEFIEEGTSKIGKYTIVMCARSSNTGNMDAIIMNTETGKTTTYILGGNDRWEITGSNLPLPE